jgi:hypothetical protein
MENDAGEAKVAPTAVNDVDGRAKVVDGESRIFDKYIALCGFESGRVALWWTVWGGVAASFPFWGMALKLPGPLPNPNPTHNKPLSLAFWWGTNVLRVSATLLQQRFI